MIEDKIKEALGNLYFQHLQNMQIIEDQSKKIKELEKQLEEANDHRSDQ